MPKGDSLLPGSRTFTAGGAAAVAAQRFGATGAEGLETRAIDEVVATGAINNDLTENVPAGAVILSVQLNVDSALTGGGTTANYAIGTSANPDLYSPIVGDLAKNSKTDFIPGHAVLGSAENIQVNGTTAGGAAGDTALTVGTVRVRIIYQVASSLEDAA